MSWINPWSKNNWRMTYFGFLAIFLGPPLAMLGALTLRDLQAGKKLPAVLGSLSPWIAILVHVLVAVVYTTPWDNYLVATGVWYYDPALVTGVRLGWVPVEEYTFFVLQTLAAGLWLLWIARRIPQNEGIAGQRSASELPSRWPAFFLGLVWVGAVCLLASGWQPGVYLALILVWALPPVALQLFFGADLLWKQRRLIFLTLSTATLYLGAADSLAIGSGTWTISPEKSLQLFIGALPIEELVFFLATNTLIVFGIVLLLSQEGRGRFEAFLKKLHQIRGARLTRAVRDEY